MKLSPHPPAPVRTRLRYPDDAAERAWAGRIAAAGRYYLAMELLTVRHGLRDAMLMATIAPDALPATQARLALDGLLLVPFAKDAGVAGSGVFSHKDQRPGPDQAFTYRAVVARGSDVAERFLRAYKASDDEAIGALLGFPACCRAFFSEVWARGYVDPIWQQAERTVDAARSSDAVHLHTAPAYNRTLACMRYIGVRTVPHFACSFACPASLAMADAWVDLARRLEVEGLDDTLAVLDLPFRWRCLEGEATLVTPAFEVTAASVPCVSPHTVVRDA